MDKGEASRVALLITWHMHFFDVAAVGEEVLNFFIGGFPWQISDVNCSSLSSFWVSLGPHQIGLVLLATDPHPTIFESINSLMCLFNGIVLNKALSLLLRVMIKQVHAINLSKFIENLLKMFPRKV